MNEILRSIAAGAALLLCLAGCSNDDPDGGAAGERAGDVEDMVALSTAADIEETTAVSATADTGSTATEAPQYEVDPWWPKQLPNRWILGQVSGIATDSQDNTWIVQRPRSLTAEEAAPYKTRPCTTAACRLLR